MRIELRQALPGPPAAVWPLLTEPELMNRWSSARQTLKGRGDCGLVGGIGALRQSTPPGLLRPFRLLEVVEQADPPRRFVYRVIPGLVVRRHRGELQLEPTPEGCTLCWDVDVRLALPLFEILARRLLEPELRSSLQRLAVIVQDAAPTEPPWCPPVDDQDRLPALWADAQAALDEQRQLAERQAAKGDPLHWFSRTYAYVTESLMHRAGSGEITHPGWVLRLVPTFHRYYVENLVRYRGDGGGAVEPHWERAFRALRRPSRSRWPGTNAALWYGLMSGIRAHVDGDLPRALIDVYETHYADRCHFERFRADFVVLTDAFSDATSRLAAEVPPRAVPLYFRVVAWLLPVELRQAAGARLFYDFARKRRRSFERAAAAVAR